MVIRYASQQEKRPVERPVSAIRLEVSSAEVARRIFAYKPKPSDDVVRKVNWLSLQSLEGSYKASSANINVKLDELAKLAEANPQSSLQNIHDSIRGGLNKFEQRIAEFSSRGNKSISHEDYDLAAAQLGKILKSVSGSLSDKAVPVTDPNARVLLEQIARELVQVKSTVVPSERRDRAAIILGKWFSASRENHINEGVDSYIVDYVAANSTLKASMFLATTKIGDEASAENRPDLSELMLFGRMHAAGFKELVLLDELPIVREMIRPDGNESYIQSLQRMFRGKLRINVVTRPLFDSEKFRNIESSLRDFAGSAIVSMDDRHLKTHLNGDHQDHHFAFVNNLRAIKRYVGSLGHDFDVVVDSAIKTTAFGASKISPNGDYHGDAMYVSITKKKGRHNIGFPSNLLPGHGIAVVYYNGKSFEMQVAPESEVKAMQNHVGRDLEKEFDVYAVYNERKEFYSYVIVKKGQKFDQETFYDALDQIMKQKGSDGRAHMGMLDIMLRLDSPSTEMLTAAASKITIDSDSPGTVTALAFKFLEKGVDNGTIIKAMLNSDAKPSDIVDNMKTMIDLHRERLNARDPNSEARKELSDAEQLRKELISAISKVSDQKVQDFGLAARV